MRTLQQQGDIGGPRFPVWIATLAGFFGLLMAILPYLSWYQVAHSSVWIENIDEIQYLLHASHAYYWHPFYLSDPTFASGGRSVYSWLQLVPAELLCKALGLHPIRFGLVLRILGGVALGFGWYALIWQHFRRPWVAFFGAVFLLTDSGWLQLRPFVRQWTILASVLLHRSGEIFANNPSIHREWRIISPVAVLPFLLFYLWALRRSIDEPSRNRLVCSGVAFGLLFYAYFYYWTAVGLALLLGMVLDRSRWRSYFHTGWIGLVVGTPELATMLFATQGHGSDWMARVDYFLPIPRLSEHGHFLFSAILVVVTFIIVRWFSPRLLYLWCLCAAGLVMIHQQLVTGLQLQNWHWAYLFSSCMTLLVLLLTVAALQHSGSWGRAAGKILVLAVILNAAAGIYLRIAEAIWTKETQRFSDAYADYEKQRNDGQHGPLDAGAVTGGTEEFVQFAMIDDHVVPLAAEYPIIWSASVSDSDLDRRVALNAYLGGASRSQFAESQRWELDHLQFGVELRDPAKREPRLQRRLAFFDQVASNPAAAIQAFQVRYVALPADSPRPGALSQDWALIQDGPSWKVWERHSAIVEPKVN